MAINRLNWWYVHLIVASFDDPLPDLLLFSECTDSLFICPYLRSLRGFQPLVGVGLYLFTFLAYVADLISEFCASHRQYSLPE